MEERKYVQKLSSKKRASDFIYGRGLLREQLGERLKCSPQKVNIQRNRFFKPQIKSFQVPALFFNISHSSDILAIALSSTCLVGIDIEIIDCTQDFALLAPFFMSKKEHEGWKKIKISTVFMNYGQRKKLV